MNIVKDAERKILSAILIYGEEALVKVVPEIKLDDFSVGIHRRIYRTALNLYEKDKALDISGFYRYLPDDKDYLNTLLTEPAVSSIIEHYVEILKDNAIRRKLVDIFDKYKNVIQEDNNREVYDIIQELDYELYSIYQRVPHNKPLKLSNILKKRMEYYENILNGSVSSDFIPTGFKEIDNIINGLSRKTLFILAGRPGMGKTALALNLALRLDKVLVFSLEMAKEELADRIFAMIGDKSLADIRYNVKAEDMYEISIKIGGLENKKIFIDDNPQLDIMQLKSKAKIIKYDEGLDVIIVDYLQLLRTTQHFSNRVTEVDYISKELKSISKNLDVCVIGLSQLNRAVEQRSNKRPDLSDLRESGGIEQNADIVALLYRDEFYNPNTEHKGLVEVNIAKHRQGRRGIAKLGFYPENMRFVDYADYQIYMVGRMMDA